MSGENQDQTTEPQDVGDLSDEQLDALLEKSQEGAIEGSLDFDQELTVGEEDSEDSEEEESKDADESKDQESESEDKDEESEDEESDDQEVEEDTDDAGVPESVLRRLELLETENERLGAELERERILRDRSAGRLGALMQQLESRDGNAAENDDGDEGDEDRQPKSKKQSSGDEALAEIRAEKVERAINGSAQDFYTENQAFFEALEKEVGAEANQEFQADLIAKVREHQKTLGEDILTMSPKMAAKVSATLLRSAFADMKLGLLRDFSKKASDEADASRRNIRDRKKGAAGVRSNKKPAVRKTQTKSLEDMSDAELDKVLAASSFD